MSANLTEQDAAAQAQAEPPAALTIDELAGRVGMSVRNLREWHGLGLIPDAEMRGRVGYYDESVVERVAAVHKLRGEGFMLPLIARMLETAGEQAPDVMVLAERLRAPFRAEAGPARLAANEAALRELGMDDAQVAAATAELREHAGAIAELFERLWMEHVWEPFLASADRGDDAEALDLSGVQAALARMQPLASEAVVAAFSAAMEERITAGIARELERGAG